MGFLKSIKFARLTQPFNKIEVTKELSFWKRARADYNKFASKQPQKGQEQSFRNALNKMQTAIDSQSKNQWKEISRQLQLD